MFTSKFIINNIFTMIFSVLFLLSCDDGGPVGIIPSEFEPDGMVFIQSMDQSFQMGSDNGTVDEQPIHTVHFTRNFWMDSTEVTQGDYDVLMRSYENYFTLPWGASHGFGDNYPAYEINWNDAVLYCNARSNRDGLDTVYMYTAINGDPGYQCELVDVTFDLTKNGYRLPTEAEWEFACRGGSSSDFFWGKDHDEYPVTPADTAEISNFAIWAGNSYHLGSDSLAYGTQPVGTKQPNGYGLYDIVGNLYEWVHDWNGDYSSDTTTDPTGPDSGMYHFLRGGSWGNDAEHLRSSNRIFAPPDYEFYFTGFRVVLPQ